MSDIANPNLFKQLEGLLKDLDYKEAHNTGQGVASYAKQQPGGADIYGVPLICDFLIFHPQKHPEGLGIILKWLDLPAGQSSGGDDGDATAGDADLPDEVFPYLAQSMLGNALNFILIVGGEGCSPEAKVWLDKECNGSGSNVLGTFWWDEFESWAKTGL